MPNLKQHGHGMAWTGHVEFGRGPLRDGGSWMGVTHQRARGLVLAVFLGTVGGQVWVQ
jgi:hypothetical protein